MIDRINPTQAHNFLRIARQMFAPEACLYPTILPFLDPKCVHGELVAPSMGLSLLVAWFTDGSAVWAQLPIHDDDDWHETQAAILSDRLGRVGWHFSQREAWPISRHVAMLERSENGQRPTDAVNDSEGPF